jgi:hypothetical protein
VTLTVTSNTNLNLVGAQLTLHSAGLPDILGAIISDPALNVLTVQFNLASAAPGARDVVVSLAGGGSVTLAGGFVVLQSPPCAYSVSLNGTLPASGGAGTLVVTATPAQCAWSATTTTSWITLLPADPILPMAQAFTVTANAGTGQRTGAITIAGENVPVSQDGTSGAGRNQRLQHRCAQPREQDFRHRRRSAHYQRDSSAGLFLDGGFQRELGDDHGRRFGRWERVGDDSGEPEF